jgi:hypothetical protein
MWKSDITGNVKYTLVANVNEGISLSQSNEDSLPSLAYLKCVGFQGRKLQVTVTYNSNTHIS